MRRRSERKKSTEVLSPPPAVKRPGRRSHRSSSQTESKKTNRSEGATISNESICNEEKPQLPIAEKCIEVRRRSRSSSSPQIEVKKNSAIEPELESIKEVPAECSGESQTDSRDDIVSENNKENTSEHENVTSESPNTENNQQNETDKMSPEKSQDGESNDASHVEVIMKNKDLQTSPKEESSERNTNDVDTVDSVVSSHVKQITIGQDKCKSPERSENPITEVENKKTFSRNRERRSQIVSNTKDEPENDENEEYNNKSKKKSSLFSTPSNEKIQHTRKRRWLSKRTTDSNSQILAISTDSLKNLISDVHPVPLCDVKLESSSDVEEVESEREDGEASPTPCKARIEKPSAFDREHKAVKKYELPMRKISVLKDGYESSQPIPPSKTSGCILYITNLVRPFTLLQLKGLLARTGKIVENRFWIDKIKSKCYVQYETEDEAIETRHALHGVRWPTSNPKCLNVEFGTEIDMEKAMASTQESVSQFGHDLGRENRIVGTGWDRDRFEYEEKRVQIGRPVREWDVGKREELELEADRAREREKLRIAERGERVIHNDRMEKDSSRNKDRGERERDRKRRSSEREHRRSSSLSPGRKIRKKNNDPPLRLLDDLFRKTKTTPCIYWLPLTPEQIAEKEAFRLRRIAEHQERVKQRELEKEKEREKERDREREREREREKERRRERDRSMGHRRSFSRDRRRY